MFQSDNLAQPRGLSNQKMGFGGTRVHLECVLPKWNGARVSHPQQLGLPNEHTKFHGLWGCRTCCGWDNRAPGAVAQFNANESNYLLPMNGNRYIFLP
jgi:hypothetical protein